MLKKLKTILRSYYDCKLILITYMPGDLGYILRYRYWKKHLRYLGVDVKIDTGVFFQSPDFIHIDDNCWIDKNVMILAGIDKSSREKVTLKNKEFKGEPGVVHIGKNIHVGISCIISGISAGVYISDDCGFSANCKIYAFTHHYRSRANPNNTEIHFGPLVAQERQCIVEGPIFIGANTGVALNSVILPGVSIPENCFIMINSVLSPCRFTSNSIISGDPARKIAERFKQ